MNPVLVSMAMGYTVEQVLAYIMKNSPQHKKAIESALKQGHTPEQVADYVMKEFEGKAKSKYGKSLENTIEGKASGAQRQRIAELRSKREQRLGTIIGGAGLAAAGAFALSRLPKGPKPSVNPQITMQNPPGSVPLPGAGPKGPMGGPSTSAGPIGAMGSIPTTQIMQAYAQHLAKGGKLSLNSFMRTAMGVMAGQAGKAQPGANPSMQEPIDVTGDVQVNTPGQPTAPMPMQQPAPANTSPMQAQEQPNEQAPTPEQQQAQKEQEADTVLEAMKLKPTIESMVKAGNQTDVIAELINFKMTPGQKAWVKEQGIDVPTLVKNYADKVIAEQGQAPSVSPMPENESQRGLTTQPESQQTISPEFQRQPKVESRESPESREPEEEIEPDNKPIITLDGRLGNVTSEKDGIIEAESEGKKLKAPERGFIPAPNNVSEIEKVARDYADSLPESEKSGPIWFNMYLPQAKVAMTGYLSDPEHMGVYYDVSQEDWDKFNSGQNIAKTSGETGHGAQWTAGEKSKYGAGLNYLKFPGGKKENGVRDYEKASPYNYFKDIAKATGKLPKPGQLLKGEAEKLTNTLIEPPTKHKPKEEPREHYQPPPLGRKTLFPIKQNKTYTSKKNDENKVETKNSEKILLKEGGKKWSKNGKERVYLDDSLIAKLIGLKYSTYSNGNISSASIQGEKISNSDARSYVQSIMRMKLFYDLKEGKFNFNGGEFEKEIVKKIKEKLGI